MHHLMGLCISSFLLIKKKAPLFSNMTLFELITSAITIILNKVAFKGAGDSDINKSFWRDTVQFRMLLI